MALRLLALCVGGVLVVACGEDGGTDETGCATQFWADDDGDGKGDPARPVEVANPCNPRSDVAPNADDPMPSCRSNQADSCGVCDGPGPRRFYVDADMDGLADVPSVESSACRLEPGLVETQRVLPEGCALTADPRVCVESAACDADCTVALCGDKTINAAAGEMCDSPDPVDGTCAGCQRVAGFRLELPALMGTGAQLCVTEREETYAALGSTLYKISAQGALEWQLAFDFGRTTAGLACNAADGVAALRTGDGVHLRRWTPGGLPAYPTLTLADLTSGIALALRSNGDLVAIGFGPCAPRVCWVAIGVNAAGMVVGTPGRSPAYGDWATSVSVDGNVAEMVVESWGVSGPTWYSVPLSGTFTELRGTKLFFESVDYAQTAVVSGTAYVFGQHIYYDESYVRGTAFDKSGKRLWPDTALAVLGRGTHEVLKKLIPWQTGSLLAASSVDDKLFLTRIDTSTARQSKDLNTALDTKDPFILTAIAKIGEGDVILLEMRQKPVVRRVAFEQRGSAFDLASDGFLCRDNRDCKSGLCNAAKFCESTSAGTGASCTSDANCASRLCLGHVCAATGQPPGTPCSSGRQCASSLCTVSGCG